MTTENPVAAAQQRTPWIFFAMACGISWLIWIPTGEWLPKSIQTPFLLLGGFGPFAAAMLLIRLTEGKAALFDWLKTTFNLRIRWIWYAMGALFLPLGMALIHHGLHLGLGGTSGFAFTTEMFIYPIPLIMTALLGGGNEEPGWRAYATPKLLQVFHPIVASAIVGIFWVVWHLPLYVFGNWSGMDQPLLWFFLYAVALSIVMTWLYLRSGRGIIPVMLLHGATNVIFLYFPREGTLFGDMSTDFNILKTMAYWTVALIILFATKGRLGLEKES
ncbi:CPBP family intramembrane glutamic endopeptidase [Candidatus Neomarinimicrobiota bacterium]